MVNKDDILTGYKRVVVKIGSGLLVDESDWSLRAAWLQKLVEDVCGCGDKEIIIVSSGAIAAGRCVLDLRDRKLDPQERQAAAAAGQMALSKAWGDAFATHGRLSAQMLLTLQDTERRGSHVNVRDTLLQLLKYQTIAVINENDTITNGAKVTMSYRYGDNDRLAARIATMVKADVLILLSDIDGLYDGNPQLSKDAQHIPLIMTLSEEIMAMAQDKNQYKGNKSLTSGGMKTKLRAAEIAVKGGVDMIITDGRGDYPLRALRAGGRHSLFKAQMRSVRARKDWIRGSLQSAGTVTVDDGAMDAVLNKGKSLLPAGVKDIGGDFAKGSVVDIVNEDNKRKAIGLVSYDSATARRIIGKNSKEIEAILGTHKRTVLIHRDDLVVL